jgi:hypothetical protein
MIIEILLGLFDEIGTIFEGIKEVINELNDLTEGEEISE